MLSVTDNSRGRAVIPRYIVCPRQIARLIAKYSVFSCQSATGSFAPAFSVVSATAATGIYPLKFATWFGVAESEAVDLFVHASAIGLFEMDWLLLCPMCACVVESFTSLVTVDNHYHCPMCRCDYEAILDDFIAVRFTVSSAVRPIVFHNPTSVSATDYCLEYRMTTDGLRADGTPLVHLINIAR